jgi:hypothetical protein
MALARLPHNGKALRLVIAVAQKAAAAGLTIFHSNAEMK